MCNVVGSQCNFNNSVVTSSVFLSFKNTLRCILVHLKLLKAIYKAGAPFLQNIYLLLVFSWRCWRALSTHPFETPVLIEHLKEILEWRFRQHFPPPSSKRLMNRTPTLKWLMVGRNFPKIIMLFFFFSFNLSPWSVCGANIVLYSTNFELINLNVGIRTDFTSWLAVSLKFNWCNWLLDRYGHIFRV